MKFLMTWLDENDEPILSFFCYFRNDKAVNSKGEECIPYLDPACTLTLADSGLKTASGNVFGSTCEPVTK